MAGERNFYNQLNSLKISEAMGDAPKVQALVNPVNLEAQNASLLGAINLVNAALMRDGRHIPNTGRIFTTTATESGVKTLVDFGGNGGAPAEGEVWRIICCTVESVAGGSGSVTHTLWLSGAVGSGFASQSQQIAKRAVTSPPVILNEEVEYPNALEIDEKMRLYYMAERSSLTSAVLQVYAYRLR